MKGLGGQGVRESGGQGVRGSGVLRVGIPDFAN